MNAATATDAPVVLLLGNYPLDRQESMLRFRNLVQGELEARGQTVRSIFPRELVGGLAGRGGLAKWLGYVDKYIFFPIALRSHLAQARREFPRGQVVVHICDHSNSVYAGLARRWFPVLVTCHDLLAVRGALGEDTDCPASGFGKILQRAILNGLGRATAVACVSRATQSDLIRLSEGDVSARTQVVPLSLNYPYRPMPRDEAKAELARLKIDLTPGNFILHVGSSLRRKNREALLHAAAQLRETWTGQIVFAGEKLTGKEQALAQSLGLAQRVVEIPRPENETLRALYSAAHALVFMSRFEGFGWPILEAQACGCPVICSNRTSVPEVAGPGALVHEPGDHAAIAQDIRRLQDATFRDNVIAQGRTNAALYSTGRMMSSYEDIYRRIR